MPRYLRTPLETSSRLKTAAPAQPQGAESSYYADHEVWLADDSCAMQPFPPDCLDGPNAIIHKVEGQHFHLGIMVFWYHGKQLRQSHALQYTVSSLTHLLHQALDQILRQCAQPEEAVSNIDDLATCVLRQYSERQLHVRAALVTLTETLKVRAPQGFIYRAVVMPLPGWEQLTFLLLPDLN